jgi:pimeloyl-ACP methyl ester carboxylesterase
VRQAILLGHSDGASIAAIHAGLGQDPRVKGLVLLAPHVIVEAVTLAGVRAARERWDRGELRDRLARHHRDPEVAFLGWNGAWTDPAFPPGFDLRPEVGRIQVPVVAIQGDADPYGTVEQVRAIEQAAGRLVQPLVLPGLGHVPHQEAPAAVLDAVAELAGRVFAARGKE